MRHASQSRILPFCSPFFVPSLFYDASTICHCLLSFFCAFFKPLRSVARKIASSSSLLLLIRICLEYQVVSFFYSVMRQVPAMHASEQLEAAWDREVRVPPGVRTDSKMGCSSHTGLATRKQRVGAHARALLRSAV